MFAIGTQVGKYVIKQLLGEGGMGTVFAAEHAVLRTRVALKVLLPRWTTEPSVVNRFINEARAAAALECENIVRIHDVDSTTDGRWYFAMDLLDGGTLADYLHGHPGPVSPYLALRFAAGIAAGLQAAHDHGIIHRDLKPDNIALARTKYDEMRPTVLDFGVAKLSDELGGGSSTRTGTVIGTPVYMAPEQLHGDPVGPAADVWALAAIVFEMITGGNLPFQHESRLAYLGLPTSELWYRQKSEAPIDPRRHVPEISEAVANVIATGLHFDPRRRPGSPRDFVLALAEALPGDVYNDPGLRVVERYAKQFLRGGAHSPTFQLPVATPLPQVVDVPGTTSPRPSSAEFRYVLGAKLGTGGMAEVFRAKVRGAEGFSRDVAMKRVLPAYGANRDFATMFVKEAQIAARLSHPNIVTVVDFDRDPEGHLFLAMEYVDGKDLSSVMEAGAVPVSVALFITTEVLRALDYAHDLPNPANNTRGIIHRDVSPQNVLLAYTGAVKLGDFGIAKAREASDRSDSHVVRGKPAYMSPEQVNGERLDGRSDLFAIGIVLWEMLAGRRLYVGSAKELFGQILTRDAPPPSAVGAKVSPQLDAVVQKLLARDRELRYATAEQARKDLAECPDWSRDGYGELVQLLAKRFPVEVRDRARGVTDSGPTSNERPRVAGQLTVPLPIPSTLGSIASQSVPNVATPSSRWRWSIAVIVAGGVGIGSVAAIVAARRANNAESSPEPSMSSRVAPTIALDASFASSSIDATTGGAVAAAVDAATVANANVDAGMASLAVETDAGAKHVASADTGSTIAAPVPTTSHHSNGGSAVGTRVDDAAPHAMGALTVSIEGSWAQVYVDNVRAGQTPLHTTVPVGRHRVRLKNDKNDKTVVVDVTATGETSVDEKW